MVTEQPPQRVEPLPGPPEQIRIDVGQDVQTVVDAYPAGSTFVLGPGVHRQQRITPRDGDRFLGANGAILDGAKVLDADSFTKLSRGFGITGQTQRTTTSGDYGCTDWSTDNGHYAQCGHEAAVYYGEELFADGNRLKHENRLVDLDGTGEWHFDYGTDTIYMYDDPNSFELLETTTTDYAFYGEGTDGVTIANLAIRHYGSRAQRGAINGAGSTNWQILGVDASYNHGMGIGIGPGMTIVNSRVTYNGQLGMGGRGDQPVSLPITIRYSEIAFNTQLGFQHGWEAGGTKFTYTDNMVFEYNWIHDNIAKGVWFDIENRNAEIRYNLVEDNTTVGIFYEISYAAKIHNNVVRNNHTSGNMDRSFGNILVVSSADVEVYANQVLGQGSHEIMGVDQDRGPGLTNFFVHDNDIVLDSTWGGGQVGVKDHTGTGRPYTTARFTDNRYHLGDRVDDKPFYWEGAQWPQDEWRAATNEADGSAARPPTPEVEALPQAVFGPGHPEVVSGIQSDLEDHQ